MNEVDQLLSFIDPHNNKQMTYSEVVQLLSGVSTITFINDVNYSKWLLSVRTIRGRYHC
jgi:hypothetical protein